MGAVCGPEGSRGGVGVEIEDLYGRCCGGGRSLREECDLFCRPARAGMVAG